MILLLALVAATAVAPKSPPTRTAILVVRAKVEATCDLSRTAAACHGAARAAPLVRRVETGPEGRRLTIEF